MELMAHEPGADGEKRVFLDYFQHGVAVALGLLAHDKVIGEEAHHGEFFFPDLDGFAQKHEAAAFGINGQAGQGRGLDGIAEAQIFGQGLGVGFGKAAADVQGVQLRRQHWHRPGR